MVTELTPREPHVRQYIHADTSQLSTVNVDSNGVVAITEEALDILLRAAGCVEVTL